MNWNDYEGVWRRQQPPAGANADLAVLKRTFAPQRRKLAASLLVRDIAEASAGVLVSAFFVLIALHQKKIAWPIGIAVVLILGVTAVFVRERIRTHRRKLSADAPLLAQLEHEIAVLQHQRRLILSLWKWYLAPIAAAIVLVGGTISLNLPSWDISRDPRFLSGFGCFFAFWLWFAWLINHRAVRKRIEPRLEELEKLRRDLLASP